MLNPLGDDKFFNKIYSGLWQYSQCNFKKDMSATIKFWIPTQILTFTVIPYHLRVPYIALIAFIWMGILSFLRGESDEEKQNNMNEIKLSNTTNIVDY